MNKKRLAHLIFLALALAAATISCSRPRPENGTVAPALTPTAPQTAVTPAPTSPPPAATATPTILAAPTLDPPTPTPTYTAVPQPTIEPVATAARLFPHSWSPDGRWLAYWTFTDDEVALDFTLPPGTLHFWDAGTGESCQSAVDVAYGYLDAALVWLPDGRIQARAEPAVLEGTPCGDDFALAAQSHFPPAAAAFSPSGAYRADTLETETGLFVTALTDIVAGETTATAEWRPAFAALGEQGVGGAWLTDELFLIKTSDRGPLLLAVSGEIIFVAAQLFGQSPEAVCAAGESCPTALAAVGAALSGGDSYHILLYGVGVVTDFPPIRVYRSDSAVVEELDFRLHGGFAPDGRTLLLLTDAPRYLLWLKALDLPGSEPRLLLITSSVNPLPVLWSPDGDQLIVNSYGEIVVFSTSGDVVAVWQAPGWRTMTPVVWSSDGRYAAARGHTSTGGGREGLFIISSGND
jgi:hypothetical protein